MRRRAYIYIIYIERVFFDKMAHSRSEAEYLFKAFDLKQIATFSKGVWYLREAAHGIISCLRTKTRTQNLRSTILGLVHFLFSSV